MTRSITGTEMLNGTVSSITKARRDLVGLRGKVNEMQRDLGAAGGDIIYLQPKSKQKGLDDEVKYIQDTIRIMDAKISELKGIISSLRKRLDEAGISTSEQGNDAARVPMPLAEALSHAYNYAHDERAQDIVEAAGNPDYMVRERKGRVIDTKIIQLFHPTCHLDMDMVMVYLDDSPKGAAYVRICDLGAALMRMSFYILDIEASPTSTDIFKTILQKHQVNNDDGNLHVDVPVERFDESVRRFLDCVLELCNKRDWEEEIRKDTEAKFEAVVGRCKSRPWKNGQDAKKRRAVQVDRKGLHCGELNEKRGAQ